MNTKLLAIGLLSSTLLASIAIAQGQPPAPPAGNAQPPVGSTDARPVDSRFITQEGSQGVLRLTDVIGQNAVGTDNKTIGKIEDVVLDRDGKVVAYIVKVSGTPGIGSRAVAVPVQAVEIDPIGMTATTGTIQSEGLPASTAEGQKARSEMQVSRVLTPGKIIVTIPTDQLKSAPAFDRNRP
ncbi:PRC-barrel domain-containing protein [Microvirga calopogonii]|uniref:PRC-barrel domain-containing protein n=1 Tax=Microvirga calopogonii TaxID=2078013 RepID=UPI000E0DA37A|nr:PRC-barrel domain-containing protein [Microvirga calopogonii]